MAGANNKQLKSAGFKAAAIRTIRISAGRGLSIKSAIGHAQDYGLAVPAKAVQKAGTSGAPEGWKAAAARVAAMKNARSGPPPGWVKAAQGKAPSERQTDVSNLNAAFRANKPTLPADVKVRPRQEPAATAPVDRRPALRAAMAAHSGVMAPSLGIASREALTRRRELAERDTPVDRRTPPGAKLPNNEFVARGGRSAASKYNLSRAEAEALILHPNRLAIEHNVYDFATKKAVNIDSPLAYGVLTRLVSGKEKLPAKYQAMADARRKEKQDAKERWEAIRRSRSK